MTKQTTWALHSAKIGSALAPTKSNKSLLCTQKAAIRFLAFFKQIYIRLFRLFWGSTDSSVGRASDLIARSRVRSSPGAQCCVIEQDTSSPLLSTG